MGFHRLPRFRRASEIQPVVVTSRDRQIVQLVFEHRFLRSSHILALIPGSRQQLLRRLQLLFQHSYLERPRAQLGWYHKGGSREIVYGLGAKGAELLPRETSFAAFDLQEVETNHQIGRVYLEHALLVSDIMVALEVACRASNIRFLPAKDLLVRRKENICRWKVKINSTTTLGVVPDRLFALEFPNCDGKTERAYFFLEADRGTMPVVRSSLAQTSFFRKLIAYEATWLQRIHERRYGFHRFRVITVTTSAARVKSLVDACGQLKQGHGLFLFADKSILEKPGEFLSYIWQSGRAGETSMLLN
jgi:hypothetical protein